MIVQVAGTNGAGKSTAVRAVMAAGRVLHEDERWSDVELPGVAPLVRVLGRYRGGVATGGADVLKSLSVVHQLACEGCAIGRRVLWEGGPRPYMNQTAGPLFLSGLAWPYVLVLLTTSLGDCLGGIDARRAARGDSPLPDPADVRGSHLRAQHYAARMRDAGAELVRCGRDGAPDRILELLRR